MADRLLVSSRKGLFIINRHGGDWVLDKPHFYGQNVTLTLHDPRDGSIYAALNLGHFGAKVHRSTDGGQTWQELPPPVYPEGLEIIVGDGKPTLPASLKMIWALEPGAASQPGRLWAGTLPGGLFRSDEHGATWELVRSLWDRPERAQWGGGGADAPGIHSICIDPRDPNIVRLGVSSGGIWKTEDDGRTWALQGKGMRGDFLPPELEFEPNAQDVHRLAQSPTAPDIFWVQHHNGIFKSEDGANTFREIKDVKPAVFGFPVVAHPTNPNVAWFVPGVKDEFRIPVDGKLVVTRTRDGGQTFEILRNGLPQEHCYDLVYRHALDVDPTGNQLAFGSTTGGLWHSDDQGDSWQTISVHLPPIHAVEFA